MRRLPKIRKEMKTYFKEDQIDREKLNYLHGGDGGPGGGGNDDGGEGSFPPLFP